MKRTHYFFLAAFVVGAALWKAGAPLLPVLLGIVMVAFWNLVRNPSPRAR